MKEPIIFTRHAVILLAAFMLAGDLSSAHSAPSSMTNPFQGTWTGTSDMKAPKGVRMSGSFPSQWRLVFQDARKGEVTGIGPRGELTGFKLISYSAANRRATFTCTFGQSAITCRGTLNATRDTFTGELEMPLHHGDKMKGTLTLTRITEAPATGPASAPSGTPPVSEGAGAGGRTKITFARDPRDGSTLVSVQRGGEAIADKLPIDQLDTLPEDVQQQIRKIQSMHRK